MARDIDREVAQKLGYHSWFHDTPDDTLRGWKILDKHGHTAIGTSGRGSELAAWAIFLAMNKWSNDLNKAWNLLMRLPEEIAKEICNRAIQAGGWKASEFALEIATQFVALYQGEQK